MLQIGEFSKICQVSVKTLHHYDKIGLLAPAEVDRITGYRFYQMINTNFVNFEDTIDREFGAFKPISDAAPKYVLSLDRFDYSRDGVNLVPQIKK